MYSVWQYKTKGINNEIKKAHKIAKKKNEKK